MVAARKGPPIHVEVSKCYGCLTCELRCSLRFEKGFNILKSQIVVRRLVDEPDEYTISFTERCDNCGICVRYCPYGALAQEAKKKEAS